ncbi:hypothetical protein GCM10022233_75690 [Streptomyces shaanxiensis]|uniref:Uncharacterized protein n=2 Tax=Streptomyces shaanxiensis TaxID=653357 RepID=A0ABP7W858_9ACTN
MGSVLSRLRRRRGGTVTARRKETWMAGEWQGAVAEAKEATGFTGDVVQRTIDGIGTALRLDHRADFYTELGTLADSGGFEAFLNHWWTQALADSAPDEGAREEAIDFADVAVSLFARAVGGPTSTQSEIDAIIAGAGAR